MVALSVNLNKIALIRNSREGNFPDVLAHASVCIEAGADGITVHPRPDQRHIRPDDVRRLATMIAPLSSVEFNVEGNPFAGEKGGYPGFIKLVEETRPDQCTLVPDSDNQLTSDHGFDLRQAGEKLSPIIRRLQDCGIRVSLFMDPDLEQIQLAKDIGADRIELYTGPYAAAFDSGENLEPLFETYCRAGGFSQQIGLGLNAGHDLSLKNLPRFISVPGLQEVSIGHALIVEAINQGLHSTVRAYKKICQSG